jgi:hypothetical protein
MPLNLRLVVQNILEDCMTPSESVNARTPTTDTVQQNSRTMPRKPKTAEAFVAEPRGARPPGPQQ